MRDAAADSNRSRIAPNGGPVGPTADRHARPTRRDRHRRALSATDACDTGRRMASSSTSSRSRDWRVEIESTLLHLAGS
jgi:hypothetical protein